MAKIEIKSTLNSEQYRKGIDQMRQKNRELGKDSGSLGGMFGKLGGMLKGGAIVGGIMAVGAALKSVFTSAVEYGGQIADMAAQADISAESFQKLARAVREGGGDEQTLVNAMVKLKDAQGEVLSGNEKTEEAFKRLGISMDEVISSDTETLFKRVSEQLTASGNSAGAFNAAAELLGKKSIPKLLDAMNAVASGGNMADGMTLVSDRSAQALDKMGDDWDNFKKRFTAGASNKFAKAYEMIFGSEGVDARIASQERQKAIQEESRLAEAEQYKKMKADEDAAKKKKEFDKAEKLRIKELKEEKQVAKKLEDIKTSVKFEIDTDKFREIGGVIGRSLSPEFMNARRQLEIQEKQQEYLKEIAENTAEESGGLE